jgi:hypothetical protein
MSTALEPTAPSRAIVTKLELPNLPDDLLCEYRGAVAEQRDDLKLIEHAIDIEIERRLRERNARELPHAKFAKIALEDQWSPYVANFDDLHAAVRMLKELGRDEDAAKVVKHVAELVTVIPAHYEYGNPVSIAALIRKYGDESEIGKLLTSGLTRTHLGTKLLVKPKPAASQ